MVSKSTSKSNVSQIENVVLVDVSNCALRNFPYDLLVQILEFTEVRDFINIGMTCKAFTRALREERCVMNN